MYARHRQYETVSIASRIEAANPHELVVILYEELIRTIDVCRAALKQHRFDALRPAQERATSVLVSLQASLDVERGGALALSLSSIYGSMRKELATAIHERNQERLATVRQGAAELMSAWLRIKGS